jgi:hypothetical protein
VLVNVDEGNNEGVYDDVLGYGKIGTDTPYYRAIFRIVFHTASLMNLACSVQLALQWTHLAIFH